VIVGYYEGRSTTLKNYSYCFSAPKITNFLEWKGKDVFYPSVFEVRDSDLY